ncbi:MAG: hypothetical protein U0805_13680 [Pirellulales bacterium]
MPLDDDYNDADDEDWYDSDDEPDEEETAPCPDCGAPVHRVADCCPACGYWLTEADRRTMWAREDKPRWVKYTVILVLLMTLAGLASLLF